MPRRRLHAQVTLPLDVVAVEELLAAHVLVAGAHVALADGELPRPAGQGVIVEADQGVVAVDPLPGARPAAEGIDLVPAQVPPPTAHEVPRRAGAAAAEYSEAPVLHLVQVEKPLQADDRGEHAGQQPALERAVVIGEAAPGNGQPVEGSGQEQEGAGVLGGGKKNSGGGCGRGAPSPRGAAARTRAAVGSASG